MTQITDNLAAIHNRIAAAAERSGRTAADVRLIAVSKGHGEEALRSAVDAGQLVLGESYVQEWQEKIEELTDPAIEWHFIGGLQSNKIRYLTDRVALIHGIDRKKLVKEIRKRATGPQEILIQVNVSGESSKSGCEPHEVDELVKYALDSEHVVPRGLMTIPPDADDPEDSRRYFRVLRELKSATIAELSGAYDMAGFTELSMGMSGDFEVAIEEGATLVRVGTAIFGPRSYD